MAELTFLPVRDSKMSGTPPFAQSINYGAAGSVRHIVLYAGATKSAWERAIVDFDVSALAGGQLLGAKLVRVISSLENPGHEAKLSRCTRPGAWVESEVTWLQYKSGSDWTTGGGDFDDTSPPAALAYIEPSAIGEHEIAGLVPFVEDALANRSGIVSLITRIADEDPDVDTGATWHSKERDESWRLVVEYASPDAGRRSHPEAGDPPRRQLAHPARPARAASPTQPHSPLRRRP